MTATNWTDLAAGSDYGDFINEICRRTINLLKQDFASDTNIPANAQRINPSTFKLEQFIASTWTAKGLFGAIYIGGAAGGSANAQTVICAPGPDAMADGQFFYFRAGYTNTAAGPTLNFNSLGAHQVLDAHAGGVYVQPGQIVASANYVVFYFNGYFYLMNPTSIWQTWTPTRSGYSANPTALYRYIIEGAKCRLSVTTTAAGTGDTNATTLTTPLPARNITGGAWRAPVRFMDAGSQGTTWGMAIIYANTSLVQIFKDCGGTVFTNGGNKYTDFDLEYEIYPN